MMGKKTLSDIKAQLGLSAAQVNGKSPKATSIISEDGAELENALSNKLDELEREIKKGGSPNRDGKFLDIDANHITFEDVPIGNKTDATQLTALPEMINRSFNPELKIRHRPKIETLSAPIAANNTGSAYTYETEVFNFLFANKETLGIKKVMRFSALLVDGAIELMDGKHLTLEIKFRMNWEKACQAEWQFRNYVKRHTQNAFPVDGGLVFFEEFSGDWNLERGCRQLVNGWDNWYANHSKVDEYCLDLLRLRTGVLENYPIAEIQGS